MRLLLVVLESSYCRRIITAVPFFIEKLIIKTLTTTGKRQDVVFIKTLEFINKLVT